MSMRTDETDRALALSALALTGERREEACPFLVDIAAWQEQRLDPARAATIEMHVSQCDACFALWRDLVACQASHPRHEPAPVSLIARLLGSLGSVMRNRAALSAMAASVAAIAVVGVYLTLGGPGTHAPPLPGYELSLQGRALFRGAGTPEEGPVEFSSGTRFELVLRPASAVSAEVAARVWVKQDGTIRELPAAPAVAARGVIVIDGRIGSDWHLPAGDSDLYVVVGREDALPDGSVLTQRLQGERRVDTDDWVAWRVPVHVGD
jgi:hypothetical protein